MRIKVDGAAVTNVTLVMEAWEAAELRDAMTRMIEQPGASFRAGFGVGAHRAEITVRLDEEGAEVPLAPTRER